MEKFCFYFLFIKVCCFVYIIDHKFLSTLFKCAVDSLLTFNDQFYVSALYV